MRPGTLFKASYFVYFASLSCLHPFLSLILSDRLGLSPRHVAAALLVKPLSGIAGGAVLCGLADQFRRHREILCLSIVASGMLMQSLYWLRPGGVVPVLVVCSLIGAFSAPVSAIIDAWCTRYIEDTGSGETYERQRLWGAVGWGAFSAISTFLVDWAGSWGPAFGLHAVFSIGTAVVSDRLAASVGAFREEDGGGREEMTFAEKFQLLRREEGFFLFIGLCMVFGLQTGVIEGWLFPVLALLPGASEFLYGISLTVTCVSETAVFHFASTIVRWLDGGVGVLNVCFAAFAARLGAYSVGAFCTVNAWSVLFIEPAHGLTFALTWTFVTDRARYYGKATHLEAFVMSVATAAMFNLSYAVGGLVGGLTFAMNPLMTFLPTLAVLLAAWAAHTWTVRGEASRPRLKTKLSGRVLRADDDEEGIQLVAQ